LALAQVDCQPIAHLHRKDPRVPTYEYRCDTCAKNFDVFQSFTDDPLTECPTCGSPVRKVFGSVGIVFKGSGFYKTDSRSGGGSASVPGESSTPASTDSGGGGKDSSPAPSTSDKTPTSSPAPSSPSPAPAATPSGKGTSDSSK
jgi:putative FmdB family regulatory protein